METGGATMTFSEGTKEQLAQQWADLEFDKQEALKRIRAKKAKQATKGKK